MNSLKINNYYQIPVGEFFKLCEKEIFEKMNISIPKWINYVKTGVGKERIPDSINFGKIRLFSIFRKLGKEKTMGIKKLSKKYSHKKNRGVKKNIKRNGGRKILRVLCNILEEKKLITKNKKGRKITEFGKKILNKILEKWVKNIQN